MSINLNRFKDAVRNGQLIQSPHYVSRDGLEFYDWFAALCEPYRDSGDFLTLPKGDWYSWVPEFMVGCCKDCDEDRFPQYSKRLAKYLGSGIRWDRVLAGMIRYLVDQYRQYLKPEHQKYCERIGDRSTHYLDFGTEIDNWSSFVKEVSKLSQKLGDVVSREIPDKIQYLGIDAAYRLSGTADFRNQTVDLWAGVLDLAKLLGLSTSTPYRKLLPLVVEKVTSVWLDQIELNLINQAGSISSTLNGVSKISPLNRKTSG